MNGEIEMPKYFLDTYALIELVKKNPNFEKFASIRQSVTGKLNLMELYYYLLRDHGKQTADREYSLFAAAVVNYSDEAMKKAMELRVKLRREKRLKLSYADAVGYQIALDSALEFVTGDPAFENLPSVEFLK